MSMDADLHGNKPGGDEKEYSLKGRIVPQLKGDRTPYAEVQILGANNCKVGFFVHDPEVLRKVGTQLIVLTEQLDKAIEEQKEKQPVAAPSTPPPAV